MSGAPGPLDNAAWGQFMGVFTAGFPDAKISVDGDVADETVVASRWTLVGTHQGDFQRVPPTGRSIRMTGVDFGRVVDGKIAEHWAQFDLLAVLHQIGALPPPE